MTAAPDEYTVDELAELVGLPTRTIRYYQSQGTLPAPRRVGRSAVYDDEHVQRLRLIASLRERGLRLDAIREVIDRAREGGESLQSWLGLSELADGKWTDEQPVLLAAHELVTHLGPDGVGMKDDLERHGLIRRVDDRPTPVYLVPSMTLLGSALALVRAGIDMAATVETAELMRHHIGRMADELVDYFTRYLGRELAGGFDPDLLRPLVDELRVVGFDALRVLYGQEIERSLLALVENHRDRT